MRNDAAVAIMTISLTFLCALAAQGVLIYQLWGRLDAAVVELDSHHSELFLHGLYIDRCRDRMEEWNQWLEVRKAGWGAGWWLGKEEERNGDE